MWVKICANTNVEDALAAAELGADALGFVFAKSPRQVNVGQVLEITSQLPDVKDGPERIGVFSANEIEQIPPIFRTAQLSGVQLHFPCMPAVVEALRREFGPTLRILQTNHWRVGGQVGYAFAEELKQLRSNVDIDGVLVDSRTMVADGGTGVSFDWEAAREAVSELGEKPLIVAGGLNAKNVAMAIKTLRPWGVDVVTGVEASPGKKDWEKMRRFIAAAKA